MSLWMKDAMVFDFASELRPPQHSNHVGLEYSWSYFCG